MTDPRAVDPAFFQRFGPWALVAGASRGLGAEYARQIAGRGLNLVLVARSEAALNALAEEIRQQHAVEVRPLVHDLSDPAAVDRILAEVADLEIGLLVYNAAVSMIGEFLNVPLEDHLKEITTNVRAPLALAYGLGQGMRARKRGGIILMASLGGAVGSALIANYSATKAYNQVLAEGLWEELRRQGVAVLSCNAGAVSTPNYQESLREGKHQQPGTAPELVVRTALNALGKHPGVVPGLGYRLSAFFLYRLMPRSAAIRMMGRVLRSMYAE